MPKFYVIAALLTFTAPLSAAHAERHNDQVASSALIGTLLNSDDSFVNKEQACALIRYLDSDLKSVLCSAQKNKNQTDGERIIVRNTTAALKYSKPILDYCSGSGDLQKARAAYKGTRESDGFPAYDPLLWN